MNTLKITYCCHRTAAKGVQNITVGTTHQRCVTRRCFEHFFFEEGVSMEYNFDTIPVKKLVWQLGVPSMLAQLFNILYSIVDRIYIGYMTDGAEMALASIGICSPAFTAITGFASLVGVGGAALMSISMGEKNYASAQYSIQKCEFPGESYRSFGTV